MKLVLFLPVLAGLTNIMVNCVLAVKVFLTVVLIRSANRSGDAVALGFLLWSDHCMWITDCISSPLEGLGKLPNR